MNYYQFNIGDYASHTTHLEPLEDLAFRRLLDFLYLHEKPLPNDLDEIAKLIRMRTHCDCIAYVLKEYFTLTDEGYINNRATSEILTFQEKSAKASASAKARWGKNKNKNKQLSSKSKGDANALRTDCEGNAIQETINTKQNTINKKQDKIPSIPYQEFIQAYNDNFAANVEGRGDIKPENITPDRKRAIKKLIDHTKKLDIEHYKSYFKYCSEIPFLNGSSEKYKADFDMLIRVKTYIKNTEGGYE